MVTSKKRKCYENRGFRQEWEETFALIELSGKPLRVICNTVRNPSKVSNPKRHYDTNHGHFHSKYPPESEICSHKIKSLKSSAQRQMTILTASSKETDVTTEASYAIAWNFARSNRPYTNDELMNENMLQVASPLHPSNKK